jgi:hypothetical protein
MIKTHLITLSVLLFAFGIIFISSVAVDPDFMTMSRDGGAFAYCGEQIAKGGLLYRDCWDNKPPAVYYLNAAVIAITGASQWSIWLFQAIWLSITTLAIFTILRKIWTSGVAFLSTSLLLCTLLYPTYFSGGNLTEIYALLPITLTLGAYRGYLSTNKPFYLIGIGLFSAIAFLFKPTYISLGIAAIFILVYIRFRQRDYRKLFIEMGLIIVSFILPLLLVGAYWAGKNSLNDLLFAVFIHNQTYVQSGFSLRANMGTLRILIVEQPLSGLFALTLISLIVFVVENWKKLWFIDESNRVGTDLDFTRRWTMAGLAVCILLDIFFVALPGTNFRHYYVIPILSMAAISAYFFNRISKDKSAQTQLKHFSAFTISVTLVILLPWMVEVIGKELPSRANWQELRSNPNITQYQPNTIEKFILENSLPEQSILIWDYEPRIYFHVDRRSPTRFIFLRHLYTPIPGAPNGFSEFMQSLQNDPPVLIITSKTAQQGLPYLGLGDDEICSECLPDIRQGVIAFKRYVEQYYQPYTDIETWAIYKRIQ